MLLSSVSLRAFYPDTHMANARKAATNGGLSRLEARGEQDVARWRRRAAGRFEGHGDGVGVVDRSLDGRRRVSSVARFEESGRLRNAAAHEPGFVDLALRGGGQVFGRQN